jgi:cellobiose phosphorylase
MKYGFFDDDKKEYVITQPDTPIPWINYLGCDKYFAIISNTASGYSFYKDPRYRRILRFRYNNVPIDVGGRFFYIRNNLNGEYWSPTWQPTRKKLEKYSCRHGLGYTIINSLYKTIEFKATYFVPLDENLEIWKVEITNHNNREMNISLFSCVEFCFWNAFDDATNFQRNLNIGEVEIEESTIYHKTEYRERRNHFSFFSCSEPLEGYDTQRRDFLGPHNGWDNPIAVEEGKSRNSLANGWSPIGSHHVKILLQPNESKTIIFVLGYFENKVNEKFNQINSLSINKIQVKQVINTFLDKNNVQKVFNELKKYWASILNKFRVNSPNLNVNRTVNIWNPYQCMITFHLSRSASFFESGISRGIGFRDSNQDLLGMIHLIPEKARERILDLAAIQLENGGVPHQYQPLTKRGNSAIGDNFNDDPLWLILSTATYLKETGDFTFLNELVTYANESGTEEPLIMHLERCIDYILNRTGPHGLPLIGRADWNDCLNLNFISDNPDESFQTADVKEGTMAESIFIAALFVLTSNELAEIFTYLKKNDKVNFYKTQSKKMSSKIQEFGWDGEWFLRAYDNFGNKIGSHSCREGKIYIEPQGFCIMSGIGVDDGMARKALNSVNKHLVTNHGIILVSPSYSSYQKNLGEISSYPPGHKENGSIFCHTNPWIIIAESIIGNNDRAIDYYLKINPSNREEISHLHYCEPYVYAQTIAGRDSENFGQAKNSWLTGTAAWSYIAMTNWILGIKPTYNGLQIEPRIPVSWKDLKIKREFRGTIYNISIKRIGNGNHSSVYVGGSLLENNTIAPPKIEQKELDVNVVIE